MKCLKLFLVTILGLVFAGMGASTSVFAQDATVASEDASSIPPIIPTSAFAAQSALGATRLSPDGNSFAYSLLDDGNTYLMVHDSQSLELLHGVNLGEHDFNWFRWAGNSRVVFSSGGVDVYRYSRLYSLSLEDKAIVSLELRSMEWDADDIVFIDPEGSYLLASIAVRQFDRPAVWRFDLDVEGKPEAEKIQSKRNDVSQWLADETGAIRIGIGITRNFQLSLNYRADGNSDWQRVARTRLDGEERKFWDFMGLKSGSSMGYSLAVPEGADRRALMEFDFSTGHVGQIVFQSESEDVSSVHFDKEGNPAAVSYSGGGSRREWLDPEMTSTRQALRQALPGSRVDIIGYSLARNRMLILQSGASDPGALYIFTPAEQNLTLISELRPEVYAALLTRPQGLTYSARDGTEIHGYLTLPLGREAQDLPMIVYPHGGPYGIRSRLSYNDTVQLLANRGYAVFQPNFRGSSGYGQAFEELGDGQIGRAMQDDLDDGVAHLVEQGTIDASRVCVVGASYGGFAAAWGVIRNPEIYRCGASWAGVMHFERQLAHDRDYLFGRNRSKWANKVDGDQTSFDLDDVSPAVQAARLNRPFLLAHGEKDSRVPFDQFELMQDRIEQAGKDIETLVLPESGHGFSGPEDEQAWYDALLEFLNRHNPAE